MKVKSESEVTQSCPTPSDPVDRILQGSSVHGIFQARVLEGCCHCLLQGIKRKLERNGGIENIGEKVKLLSTCLSPEVTNLPFGP